MRVKIFQKTLLYSRQETSVCLFFLLVPFVCCHFAASLFNFVCLRGRHSQNSASKSFLARLFTCVWKKMCVYSPTTLRKAGLRWCVHVDKALVSWHRLHHPIVHTKISASSHQRKVCISVKSSRLINWFKLTKCLYLTMHSTVGTTIYCQITWEAELLRVGSFQA